jgi:hypothetical protein
MNAQVRTLFAWATAGTQKLAVVLVMSAPLSDINAMTVKQFGPNKIRRVIEIESE